MAGQGVTVDEVLHDLLRYEEVLGVIAVNVDGLVIGSAGVDDDDADMAGALGIGLLGTSEGAVQRLGAGEPGLVSVATSDGVIHLQRGGDVALIVFSEPADGWAVGRACQETIARLDLMLGPIN